MAWVSSVAGLPTGSALLYEIPIERWYVDRREKEIRVSDIAILPEFRGKGIGTHLLTKIIDEGKEKQLPISLHAKKNNPARALYARMGFEPVKEDDVYDFLEIRNR